MSITRSVSSNGYGKLSGKSLDELRAGERVAVLDGKEDPCWISCCGSRLKPEEPLEAKVGSVFGTGRPGWHIECSAMSRATLGTTSTFMVVVQTCRFPHHENEIAQAKGLTGKPWRTSGCTTALCGSTTRR